MSSENESDEMGASAMAEHLRRIPLFDGYPYLVTRVVPAVCHIMLLPDDWSRDQLIDALWRQVAANQMDTALVLSEELALYLTPGGAITEGSAPRSQIVIAGQLLTAMPLTPGQVGHRAVRLAALTERSRARGGFVHGDRGKGGHKGTTGELARLSGPGAGVGGCGLARCATCHEWRGQCLDSTPGHAPDWVVPVHCRCDNVTCCARCGEPFGERRVGGNHLDEADGRIWHSPGFMALGHKCPLAEETDRLPAVDVRPASADATCTTDPKRGRSLEERRRGPGLWHPTVEQDDGRTPTPTPSIWRSEEVRQVLFYGCWVAVGAHGALSALVVLFGSGPERIIYAPPAVLPVVMLGATLVEALRSARRRLSRGASAADSSRLHGGKR